MKAFAMLSFNFCSSTNSSTPKAFFWEIRERRRSSASAFLSPQSTLDRGYAVVQNADGHVIDDAGKVSAGDHLTLTLRKGVITATAQ